MTMKLIINEVEVNLGIESMKDIVSMIADKVDCKDAHHEMALSNIASIRADIAYKENISEETAKLLLADRDNAVLENIVSNKVVQSVATNEDIEHIITYASQSTLKGFVSYIAHFENIDTGEIYAKLLAQNNPDITLSIAESYDTPKRILKKLAKDSDVDIAKAAKNCLDYI